MPSSFHTCRRVLLGALLAGAALQPVAALAQQDYPRRQITLVYPYGAGSAPESGWRAIAQEASRVLGQPIVFENRTGAGGRIGFDSVRRAQPDGYTLGIVPNGVLIVQPLADPALKVEPGKDYLPVVRAVDIYQVLVAHPSMPFRDVKSLIAYAKANPGKLAYSSGGAGNQSHVGMERFKTAAGIDILHVPYKGEGAAVTDVLAGQVQLSMPSGSAKPHVDKGTLIGLATTGPRRWSLFPQLPTLIEAGLPGLTSITWMGVIAPPGTPADVVAKVNSAFNAALKAQPVHAKLEELGFTPVGSTPAEFETLVRDDLKAWEPIIRKANIKLN